MQPRGLTELEPREIRVLGALMEKEQTTPEYYPLTLKSLVTACNQKTNRDPVMSLGELETLNVLRVLLQERLVERVSGPRADRWEHHVDEILHFKSGWKSVITVLFLRGAQTLGELRARTERMHPFSSLEEVEAVLRELAAQLPPLAVELARRPGQKESRWAFNVEGATETAAETPVEAPTGSDAGESLDQRVSRLEDQVSRLRRELSELKAQLGEESEPSN